MAARPFLFIGLTVSLAAAAALAQETPAPEKERRICRGGGERQLGSHTRTQRRCRTAEQWRQEDEARARAPVSLTTTEGQNDGRVTATPN
ncbi:MAG TPA: hypothetical protein VEW04_02150 [Allosphingosinicella sp.]|nr:hypothetical protein [Allosphingosinicella sp.]